MKKLLSLVLAVLMLAMPALSLGEGDAQVIGGADEPTDLLLFDDMTTGMQMLEEAIAAGRKVTVDISVPEVNVIKTGDDAVDTAIVDLLTALGLDIKLQGDEYDFALTVSDKDLLTLGWAVSGEDAYIKSNLIGGTIVLTAADVEPLVGRLLDMFVMLGAIPEEQAASIKESLSEVIGQFEQIIAQSMDAMLTEEDFLTMDYSALISVLQKVMADLEEKTEIVVPKNCDPAVYGMELRMDNAEFVAMVDAFLEFIQDNPKLMNYIGLQSGMTTEAVRAQDWEVNGAYYTEYGWYATEEEYIADNPTFAEALEQFRAELVGKKLLDGEFVIAAYTGENDELVYLTAALPMFTEQTSVVETEAGDASGEVKGVTEVLNIVYTRQTVAQGVSHVCNIDVDGEGASIDVLAQENAAAIRIGDLKTQELLLTINAAAEGCTIKGDFAAAEESGCTGTFSVTRDVNDSQFVTGATFDLNIPSADAEAAAADKLSIAYSSDYTRSGVDFSGEEVLSIVFNDVKVVVNFGAATADADESIMVGQVVRLAELSDADFANWFVGAYNAVFSWVSNALMALPASVQNLIMSMSGM